MQAKEKDHFGPPKWYRTDISNDLAIDTDQTDPI